jgi:hypothetical protein
MGRRLSETARRGLTRDLPVGRHGLNADYPLRDDFASPNDGFSRGGELDADLISIFAPPSAASSLGAHATLQSARQIVLHANRVVSLQPSP